MTDSESALIENGADFLRLAVHSCRGIHFEASPGGAARIRGGSRNSPALVWRKATDGIVRSKSLVSRDYSGSNGDSGEFVRRSNTRLLNSSKIQLDPSQAKRSRNLPGIHQILDRCQKLKNEVPIRNRIRREPLESLLQVEVVLIW